MRLYIFTLFLILYSITSFAQKPTKYPVSLISIKLPQGGVEQKILEQDRQYARMIAKQLLEKHCRFFDEKLYKQKIDRMYAENPDLDPTSITNKLAALQLPTKLIILLETQVKTFVDSEFPICTHEAYTHIKVVDKWKSSEIYAEVAEKSQHILQPPLRGGLLKNWQNNRLSRDKAISEALKIAIGKLLLQMAKKRQMIDAFELLAVRLTGTQKTKLYSLLSHINSTTKIKITDIRAGTDRGITANVYCPSGKDGFRKILNKRFIQSPQLKKMLCEIDGFKIKVRPRKKSYKIPTTKGKFAGRLVFSPDIEKIKRLGLDKSPTHKIDQITVADSLQQYMQNSFHIYDSKQLWDNLAYEAKRFGETATTSPGNFWAKKYNLATHTIYFWTETNFRNDSAGKYCFAALGIRLVRMVDARQIAMYNLSSEEEFQRGVKVTRTKEQARKQAIQELVKVATRKLVIKLKRERPTIFKVNTPYVFIKGKKLSKKYVKKLTEILADLEDEREIVIKSAENTRESVDYRVYLKKNRKKSHTLTSLRQRIGELCEEEQMAIFLESEVGKIYITMKSDE